MISFELCKKEGDIESMISKLIIIILVLALTTIQVGDNTFDLQVSEVGQDVSDAQKKEFIELLRTLPSKGEFYTEEAARKAAPYLPVLFSFTEKDIKKDDLYPFFAISVGICQVRERRVYAVAHFKEIRHPLLKLFWAAFLFNLNEEISPEIVRYLRDALDSTTQEQELRAMSGPEFRSFRRDVRNHPFAQDRNIPFSEVDEGHVGSVSSIAFSPDGNTLLSGSHDGTLILWDVVTGKQLRSIDGHRKNGQRFSITSVAFSPDGKSLLAACDDKTLRFWDAATGAELRVFNNPDYSHTAVFSPDGTMVAGANCESVILWDALTGRLLHTFRVSYCATHVAFSPDGRTLLNDGGLIQVRDLATGRVLKRFGVGATPGGMALSHDGKSLMLGGLRPALWNVMTGRLRRWFPEEQSFVIAVAFSPVGDVVASESQESTHPSASGVIKLWDLTTGRELRRLRGHQDGVKALHFSPDGKWLASGSRDHTIKLWDVGTGQEIRSFPTTKKE